MAEQQTEQQLIWKCEGCEWAIEGTASGSAAAMRHKKDFGEGHDSVLRDAVSSEIKLDDDGKPVRSLSKAQKLGYIPLAKTAGKSGRPAKEIIPSKGLKGQIQPEVVNLDTRLRFLYEWDRMMWPDYSGDFSQWIWESVFGFHVQNKEVLKFDMLFHVTEEK